MEPRSLNKVHRPEFYLKARSHTAAIFTTTGLHTISKIVTETELLMSILVNVDATIAGVRFLDCR